MGLCADPPLRAGRCSCRTSERGIALPLAIVAIVLLGALVTGHFMAGVLEWEGGRNSLYLAQALEAAQAGLDETISETDAVVLETLSQGSPPLVLPPLYLGDRVSVTRQIERISPVVFLLRASGVKQSAGGLPLAVQSLGLMTRVVTGPSPAEPSLTISRLVPLGERAWVPLF
jgi:hypothetical protein